jgi:hypothetical protein
LLSKDGRFPGTLASPDYKRCEQKQRRTNRLLAGRDVLQQPRLGAGR